MEKKAGIKAFEIFTYINTINSLANGDITKWDYIMNLSYAKVLTKLLLNQTQATFEKKHAELMKQQNKIK